MLNLYIYFFYDDLVNRGGILLVKEIFGFKVPVELIIGAIGILILLEATRRAIGLPLVIIAVCFLLFSYFGKYAPDIISHGGLSVKRLVGFPGDKIQFKDGDLFINEQKISKNKSELQTEIRCGERGIETTVYEEQLDTQNTHLTAYLNSGSIKNTDVYVVPSGHYFMLGDNRDCSKDSRFLSSVGFIPKENLVGKASIIFFSNDTLKGSMFNIFNLHRSFRLERLFKTL